MKLRIFACLAAMLAVTASFAFAQDDMAPEPTQVDPMQTEVSDDTSVAADYGKGCCDVCCDQSSFLFQAEATFFKFLDQNGVEDFNGNDGTFDYNASPRLTLGYVGCDGLGARLRYWEYDQSTRSVANQVIAVDTYYIDLEMFQAIELGSCTSVELSGGIRYNEFDMDRSGARRDSFNGFGGMLAIEARRDIGCNLTAYGRFRQVLLSDDFFASGASQDENDAIRANQEISLGVMYTNCNWTINAGYEWQMWQNYTRGVALNIDEETDDVGFAGFVVGAGYSY